MLQTQFKGQRGQGGVEYALVLSGIAIVIILVTGALFTVIRTQFRNTLCEMDSNGRVQYECNDGTEPGMPIAAFTVDCSGLECEFDGSTSRDTNNDGLGTIVAYDWNFGGSTGSGVNPTFTFPAAGTYDVILVVTDDDGNTGSVVLSLNAAILNNAPTVNLTVSCTGLTCTFTPTASDSDGSIISWELDYGDGTETGTTSTVPSFTHTYTTSGSRTIKFKATDDGGKSSSVSKNATATVPPELLAHVDDIDKSSAPSTPGYWQATVEITVKDGNGAVMAGVTVTGSFNNGGGSSLTCTTNASGMCSITSQNVSRTTIPSLTFTMSNISGTISGSAIVYNSSANVDLDGTSTGTYTTIANPSNANPTAVINLPVNCTGSACTFSGSGTDSDGSIAGYSWSFGGAGSFTSGSATTQTGTYNYTNSGTYTITLTVTDDLGGTSSPVTTTVNVTAPPNTPPTATIGTMSCANQVCTFAGSGTDSDGSIASYAWDFVGPGSFTSGSASSQSGVFTYTAAGTYAITLTVTDNLGATGTATNTQNIVMANTIHIADLDGSGSNATGGNWQAQITITVKNNLNVAVSGAVVTGSFSPTTGGTGKTCTTNASGVCTLTSTGVNKNGGSAVASLTFTVSSVTSGSLVYDSTANTDPDVTDSNGTAITVSNPGNATPVANISSITCTNLVCTFSGTGTDSDGTISTYSWNFGGAGSFTSGSASSQSGTYTYTSAGTYTITFAVTDNGGATGSASASRTVTAPVNAAPVATIGSISCPNLTCTFTGSGTDSDGSISTYSWNFGGAGSFTTGNSGLQTGAYTYTSPGTYTITLTVTDNSGATGTATTTKAVVAANVAPTATIGSMNCTNLACTFSGSGTDSDGTIASYSWSFGGGGNYVSGSSSSQTGTFAYTTSGTYTITLTVTDNAGSTGSTTLSQTVSSAGNTAPTAAINSVTCTYLVCTFSGSGSDSNGTIIGYSWSFGGGGSFTSGSATSQTGTYTYSAAGTYTITLTVTDNGGATGSATATRAVTAATMWIDDVDATGTNGTGNKWTLNTITFHVRDTNGNNINGAVISVTDVTPSTKTCTTGSAGTCTISTYSIFLNNGSDFTTLTVNSVTLSGYVYQAGSNGNSDGDGFDISSNTITINNPN